MGVFTRNYGIHAKRLITECFVTPVGKSVLYEGTTDVFNTHMYAEWDTGAGCTTISERIIKDLNLVKVGSGNVNTMHGVGKCEYYKVDLILPGNITFKGLTVMKGNLLNIDVLIGMDIMSLGSMAFSNVEGKTTFTFQIPSDEVIDFTKGKI